MTLQYKRITDLNQLQKLIREGSKLYTKRARNSVGFEYIPVVGVYDLYQDIYVSIRPTTINGIVVNSPLQESDLEQGKTYYIASLTRDNKYFTATYRPTNSAFINYLKCGCVFETPKDAQVYIMALNNYPRS